MKLQNTTPATRKFRRLLTKDTDTTLGSAYNPRRSCWMSNSYAVVSSISFHLGQGWYALPRRVHDRGKPKTIRLQWTQVGKDKMPEVSPCHSSTQTEQLN